MKKTANICLFVGFLCILVAGAAVADGIEIGDSKEKVLKVLGFPKGQMAVGGGLLMLYDRGTVTIENGKATGSTVVSAAEAAAEQADKEREEAARRAARASAREKRIAAGRAEKAKTEADEKFKDKSAAAQLAYWRAFQKKYPEVDVSTLIAPLAEEAEGSKKADRKKEVTERIGKLKSEIIPQTEKDTVRQYQFGGQRKRRAARMKLKQLKAELAKLDAELKTL